MSGKTILVVDDSPTIYNLLKNALVKDGFQVKVAVNGLEALDEVFRQGGIDLIILDVEMPKMNGYEVCRVLKKHPVHKKIPIIMLTLKNEESDKDWGLDLGAEIYLTKPFEYENLKKHIATFLN
jgi:DNA-binding response OmpR family regulator